MLSTLRVVLLLGLVFAFWQCQQTKSLESTPISLEKPAHFPTPKHSMQHNPLTEEGFELGRKLFYDPILSKNQRISCATCHQLSAAFSHPAQALSRGIEGRLGKRNAPPIFNMLWHSTYFWDGGVLHLELVPLSPIQNPVEMDENLKKLLKELQKHPQYPSLFQRAFGSDSITTQKIMYALEQFMAHLVSANARYDQYLRGEASLNEQELAGLALFEKKCSHCHVPPLFSDFSFRNNGLDTDFEDLGRALITEKPSDEGRFKVPSLRNIVLTFPYMHDGRFETLEEVLEHYATGVKASPTLDPFLQKNGHLGIPLSRSEKEKILLFLHTLTDKDFTKNLHFGPPS